MSYPYHHSQVPSNIFINESVMTIKYIDSAWADCGIQEICRHIETEMMVPDLFLRHFLDLRIIWQQGIHRWKTRKIGYYA